MSHSGYSAAKSGIVRFSIMFVLSGIAISVLVMFRYIGEQLRTFNRLNLSMAQEQITQEGLEDAMYDQYLRRSKILKQ